MSLKPLPFMVDRHDLVTEQPGNPGAGIALSYTRAGKAWQLVGVGCRLVTSAVVGDRHLHVYIENNAGLQVPFTFAGVTQAASLTYVYFFTIGVGFYDGTGAASPYVQQPLGCCYQLKTTDKLEIDWYNKDSGDVLNSIYVRLFDWTDVGP